MLKKEFIKMLLRPGKFEAQFKNYLAVSGAEMKQTKTIALQVLNDARHMQGQKIVDFFKGTLNPANTNIENQYIRPESEHFLIYKIRFYAGNGQPNAANFVRGQVSDVATMNSVVDVYVNGIVQLKAVPLAEFFGDNIASNDRGTLQLDEPILWQGNEQLLLQVTNKSSTAYGNVSYRFDMVGIGMI